MRRLARDAAYVEYVSARQARIRRFAYLLCGDWHRAEDATATALARLYVARPRIRQSGSEDAYVRRIV